MILLIQRCDINFQSCKKITPSSYMNIGNGFVYLILGWKLLPLLLPFMALGGMDLNVPHEI